MKIRIKMRIKFRIKFRIKMSADHVETLAHLCNTAYSPLPAGEILTRHRAPRPRQIH